MISQKEYSAVRRSISKLEQERNKVQGAIEQIQKTLKDEFNCKSLEQAERKAAKLQKDYEQKQKAFILTLNKYLAANRKALKLVAPEDFRALKAFARKQKAAQRSTARKAKAETRTSSHRIGTRSSSRTK